MAGASRTAVLFVIGMRLRVMRQHAACKRRVALQGHGVFSLRRRDAPRLGLTTSPGHVRSIAEKARQTKIKLEKVSSLTAQQKQDCSCVVM